jgi:CelD/BcsL family acetyltransferase involved in cellulose biosynthesis
MVLGRRGNRFGAQVNDRGEHEQQARAGNAVLLTSLEELEPFEEEWRSLALARENPHISPDFFRAWAENFVAYAHPFVPAIIGDDGRLRGLLPLVITRDATRQVQCAGANFWMPLDPVARPEDEEELGIAAGHLLAAHRDEWRAFTLDNVPSDARWLDVLSATLTRDYGRGLITRSVEHPWLVVEMPDGWNGYLANRSAKFRHEQRRIERRMSESHQVTLRETATADELHDDLETLFRFHSLRRTELGGSTYDEPAMRKTIEDFAASALANGYLRLRLLELDGESAAVNLCFRAGGRCACYILSWDPRWASISLGRIMMSEGILAAVCDGVREYELSVGWSKYKAEYATSQRTVRTTWFYPRRTAAVFKLRRVARILLPAPVRRVIGRRMRSAAGRVDMPS